MTDMKTIAYSFWVGAALYLFFAVSVLLSIHTGFYVSTVLKIAALVPVVLYLVQCPAKMPLKAILGTFIFISVICGTALSVYSNIKLSSLGDTYTSAHEMFFQQYRIISLFYGIVIMFLEAIISWQLIKWSRTFSFVWWTSIIIFILAFRPIYEIVITTTISYPYYTNYLNILYSLHNISFAILFIAIGMFFRPTVK